MNSKNFCVVVTTINNPNHCMNKLLSLTNEHCGKVIVVADLKTPSSFGLMGAKILSVDLQKSSKYELSKLLPYNHYSRKNLGYLEAFDDQYDVIYETDDDNYPKDGWIPLLESRMLTEGFYECDGFVNVYNYFTESLIWPRGLPLQFVEKNFPVQTGKELNYFIRQGLADTAPDVDAIWRKLFKDDFFFEKRGSVGISNKAYCPFNSQNTWWSKQAFPLMYLPSYCSFRMTDIWRGFIAQRCIREMNGSIAFFGADVEQDRNLHNLDKDFEDEVPGYLLNEKIIANLDSLTLYPGQDPGVILNNLHICYESLIELKVFPSNELPLVDAWCADYLNIYRI